MSERKEKSASQIQIEERQERLFAMHELANDLTKEAINEAIRQHPQTSEDSIFSIVKNFSISEIEFIATYTLDYVTVSMKTAKEYFDAFSMAKKFVSMEKKRFRLNDELLRNFVKVIILEQKKKEK